VRCLRCRHPQDVHELGAGADSCRVDGCACRGFVPGATYWPGEPAPSTRPGLSIDLPIMVAEPFVPESIWSSLRIGSVRIGSKTLHVVGVESSGDARPGLASEAPDQEGPRTGPTPSARRAAPRCALCQTECEECIESLYRCCVDCVCSEILSPSDDDAAPEPPPPEPPKSEAAPELEPDAVTDALVQAFQHASHLAGIELNASHVRYCLHATLAVARRTLAELTAAKRRLLDSNARMAQEVTRLRCEREELTAALARPRPPAGVFR